MSAAGRTNGPLVDVQEQYRLELLRRLRERTRERRRDGSGGSAPDGQRDDGRDGRGLRDGAGR